MPHFHRIAAFRADAPQRQALPGSGLPWAARAPLRIDALLSAPSVLARWATGLGTDAFARPPAATQPRPALRDRDATEHEAQHRIANSVQIIASLLQNSLRDTASADARREIDAAYHRIMAVAALQRALFETDGKVAFAPYLNGIGRRIGQSFLVEGGGVAIRILCRPVTLDAATATNIGLVVTELLINAIKHAFPDGRRGTICVTFHPRGAGWVLAVSDTGIGPGTGARQGFGSRIVPALVAQLGAQMTEGRARPGSRVVLTRG